MKNLRLGCIGTGNMGAALLRGIVKSGLMPPGRIMASDRSQARRQLMRNQLKIRTSRSNTEAIGKADLVILAVKPQILDKVLVEIKDAIPSEALIVSIAAGYPTALIEQLLGGKPRVIRAMPNITATVRMGATALCKGRWARRREMDAARRLFASCGLVEEVEEWLMDSITGLSGTGPMYVFIIIEALSDAGVKVGLGREVSTRLAVQTVLGAARMVQETGRHPIYLKDLVTSPGGTAINALYSMEKTGLRAVIMDAVEAATRRSRELGKPVNE